jgi:hypothetical protein
MLNFCCRWSQLQILGCPVGKALTTLMRYSSARPTHLFRALVSALPKPTAFPQPLAVFVRLQLHRSCASDYRGSAITRIR